MVDNKRLDELMLEKYPQLVYDAEQADEFLKNYKGNLEDEDVVAWNFAEHVSGENMHFKDKFTVIKYVGKNDKFVVREFNVEDDAKKFVDLLRKSEQLDFIKYSITQTLNY